MKTIAKYILVIFISLYISPSNTFGQYKLVWQDNFDGKELDAKFWNVEVNGNGGGNSELQYYKEGNVSVGKEPLSGENCLIIRAIKENYLDKKATSGRINSRDKISFKYGKLEARIKLPKTKDGLWPAFWMLGANHEKTGWPRCGEIDIMEMGNVEGIKNGTQDRFFNGACHWGFYQPEGWYPNFAKHQTNRYDLQNTFHLYTLIWDSKSIRMYLDMDKYPDIAPYYEMGIADFSSELTPGIYFNKPFFVLFNLAIGGNFTQLWDINQITAFNNDNDTRMYVDYVRLYQRGESGEEFYGEEQSNIIPNGVKDLRFYASPNPAYSQFSLKGMQAAPAEVHVTSTAGKLMLSVYNSADVDISSLPEGSYVVLAIDINRKIYTCLFVKKSN